QDQAFVDPYTGRVLGTRLSGETPFKRQTLIGFIYRLHTSLAMRGKWGEWILGVVAVAWTLDCFVGFLLTLQRHRPFMPQWRLAGRIKGGASSVRFNWDLHRGLGLWLWAVLLLYAWSSVQLNLREQVYRPVMSTLFDFSERPVIPRRAEPLDRPAL